MRKETPMWWDGAEQTWYYAVPFTMPQKMIQPAIDYVLKVSEQRLRSLPPGDAKGDLSMAIDALKLGKVLQWVMKGPGGAMTVFKSTPRIGNRIISLGGRNG